MDDLPSTLTVHMIARRERDDLVPVLDELGRPVFLQSSVLAALLASAMVAAGATETTVLPLPLSPNVGDVLLDLGLDERSFSLVEAQAVSAEDAVSWIAELAERLTRVES